MSTFAQWRAQTRDELTEMGTEVDVDGTVSPAGAGARPTSTGSNATVPSRLVVVDIKTGKTPVSKDDAQRHAQLAMYQLAVAEGLLPQGDIPGTAGWYYLGKTRSGRRHRTRAGRADPHTRAGWRSSWCGKRAAATQGPQFLARINDGCAHCPVRPCARRRRPPDGRP